MDHSLASSWRGQPSYPAANSKTGASRTDGWEGGGSGTGGAGAAEEDNGTSAWGYPSSTSGANAWGSAGTGGSGSQTSGVSQGGWGSSGAEGVPGCDWGAGGSAGAGGANPAGEGMGGASSSNSSSSGGSTAGNVAVTTSSPPTATTTTRAWDNQKGDGEMGEWGGGGERQGAQGGSSSSGGNSRSGSWPNSSQNRSRHVAPNAEAALQNLLSRSDLDPRVLSNTGWGQTQIRQNTSWEFEENAGQNKGGSSFALKQASSAGGSSHYSGGPRAQSGDSMGPAGANPAVVPPAGTSGGEGWESSSNSSSSGASLSGRAPPSSGPNRNLGVSQSGPVTTAGPMMGSGAGPGHGQQGKATGRPR